MVNALVRPTAKRRVRPLAVRRSPDAKTLVRGSGHMWPLAAAAMRLVGAAGETYARLLAASKLRSFCLPVRHFARMA